MKKTRTVQKKKERLDVSGSLYILIAIISSAPFIGSISFFFLRPRDRRRKRGNEGMRKRECFKERERCEAHAESSSRRWSLSSHPARADKDFSKGAFVHPLNFWASLRGRSETESETEDEWGKLERERVDSSMRAILIIQRICAWVLCVPEQRTKPSTVLCRMRFLTPTH